MGKVIPVLVVVVRGCTADEVVEGGGTLTVEVGEACAVEVGAGDEGAG